MRKAKRFAAGVLASVMVISTMTGCGGSTESKSNETTAGGVKTETTGAGNEQDVRASLRSLDAAGRQTDDRFV